jgi:hypothetical protein
MSAPECVAHIKAVSVELAGAAIAYYFVRFIEA